MKIYIPVLLALFGAFPGLADSAPNADDYFVNIQSVASNGGEAILGSRENPEGERLSCDGGFQSESIFSIHCEGHGIQFSVWNLFEGRGELSLDGERGPIVLHCKIREQNNPFSGGVCR